MEENVIISGSSDATLRIWNLEIKETKPGKHEVTLKSAAKILRGHKSDIYCVDACGDYIVSGGADSIVIVWNFNGEKLHELNGYLIVNGHLNVFLRDLLKYILRHLGIVRFLYIDEFKLVSGGDAKKIMIWDYKVKEIS